MKYAIFILLTCVVFFSCKKKDPPVPVVGTPVFKFIGSVGKDTINYQAGLDHMFMYTGFFKDTQNLLTVKSYFGKDTCTNCEPYLSFEVKDFDVSNNNGLAGTLSQFLHGGTFTSYSLDSVMTSTTVEQFKFIPEVNTAGAVYQWNFGDGGTSTQASPSYVYSMGGLHTVQLKVSAAGASDSLSNVINTDKYSGCRVQFNMIKDTMLNMVTVNAFPNGFQYTWDFGDGHFGQSQSDTNTYTTAGKYLISLTAVATAPSGCSSVYRKKVDFSFLSTILANFSYTTKDTTIVSLIPRINKSAFIITWIKNGVTYKSFKNIHGLNQSGNPVFTFTGVAPYQNNANGNKTVLVTGTVDTYLYNQSNASDSIKIKSDNVVLAAAYPD